MSEITGNNNQIKGDAMKERIVLYRNCTGWVAKFDDPKVAEVMGTDVIPTAFTKQAKASTVRDAIQALNPHAIVEVWGNENWGDGIRKMHKVITPERGHDAERFYVC